MSLESALAHYSKAYERKTTPLQELAKATPSPALDAVHFYGRENSTNLANESRGADDKAWTESVLTLLADAITLGRELDRTNFYRDPQIGLALELVRQGLRKDPVENNAFVAELLAIALENAKEIAASDVDNKTAKPLPEARRALAEDSWSVDEKKKAAVIGALVKSIQDAPVQNPLAQMSVAKGKSLAREVWKTVEPRGAFWDRGKPTRTSASVQKSTPETKANGGLDRFWTAAEDEVFNKLEGSGKTTGEDGGGGKRAPESVQKLRSAKTVGELRKAMRDASRDLIHRGDLDQLD
jgi:hypothetical protein